MDRDRDGKMRVLISFARWSAPERIHGKTKGKEMLVRYNGETIEEETALEVSDPRKDPRVKRLQQLSRIPREEYHETQFTVRIRLHMASNFILLIKYAVR